MVSSRLRWPDVGARVHVDGGHRLGLVDDDVAAGLELHLAVERLLDLVLHPIEVEDGPAVGIEFYQRAQGLA